MDILASRSPNTAGAKGIQKSRCLIKRLIVCTTEGRLGSAKIERFPSALAPNSIRPEQRATMRP